jgi:hypothetical protein
MFIRDKLSGGLGSVINSFKDCPNLNYFYLKDWSKGADSSKIANGLFENCGIYGGVIAGLHSQDFLDSIHSKNSNWLKN